MEIVGGLYLKLIICLLLLVTLNGCLQKDMDTLSVSYYKSVNEVISNQFNTPQYANANVLGIEPIENESLVIFQQQNKLGTGIIKSSEKGYFYIRTDPYISFDTNESIPYTSFQSDIHVENRVVKMVSGLVIDQTIKQVNLIVNGVDIQSKAIPSHEKPVFYYFLIINQQSVPSGSAISVTIEK